MSIMRPIDRPSSWYEPDDDEWTEQDHEQAYEAYEEEYGKEPDVSSRKWEKYFEDWLYWKNRDYD